MQLVDRKDIERWAAEYDSKGYLPLLVSRLVRATAPQAAYVDFPSGSAVFVGGYDGYVNSPEGKSFVPAGISLWELGTEGNPKSKADRDYIKRTENPENYKCRESTFVFVTPLFWAKKDKWRTDRLSEGKWKEIRVYDSSNLEQWLGQCPAVSRWFSAYIGKYPKDGILTSEESWKEWSTGPLGQLPPEIICAGRKREMLKLKEFLTGKEGIKNIQAASKDEAIAFILASAYLFDQPERERFFAGTVIVNTPDNFRGIRINSNALNLVANFNEQQVLYAAVADGHHVLVPLGPEDETDQDTLILPTVDREGQIQALVKMGISGDDAERFSKEAGRNVTVLKRLLNFRSNRLAWHTPEFIHLFLPALFIGRWHDKKQGDQSLLESLSALSYEQYREQLDRFCLVENSPLLKIGDQYRLLSPLDMWTSLAGFIRANDLKLLEKSVLTALQSGNPLATPPTEELRWMYEFNKEKIYSSWSREGLLQSLILIAIYGNSLKLSELGDSQNWVDRLIYRLFDHADEKLWISLDREMPLIAEASPERFLDVLGKALKTDPSPVIALFGEEEGLLHKTSHHTGMLWALESLAWLPEYLNESSVILATLSRLDPGGQLSNRPFNSLVEIFKYWHHQTLASLSERMAALQVILNKEPEIGRRLLLSLLPDSHGVAHPTHKMRWRVFDRNFNITYTYQQMWETTDFAVHKLIEIFDGQDVHLAGLLESSVDLSPENRKNILKLAVSWAKKLRDNTLKSWAVVRGILSRHRSYPDTEWALGDGVLEEYQVVYDMLTPEDTLSQLSWMFNDWPDFPEGSPFDNKIEEIVLSKRTDAAKTIYSKYGLSAIIALSAEVKEPWSLGSSFAFVLTKIKEVKTLLSGIDENQSGQLLFIGNFFALHSKDKDVKWVRNIWTFLVKSQFSELMRTKFLTSLTPSMALWKFIEGLQDNIKTNYWLEMRPWFFGQSNDDKLWVLEKLINHRRFFTAINQMALFVENVPSGLLMLVLESAATIQASEKGRFDFHVEKLLEKVAGRDDISRAQKIKLEWLYLPVLAGNRTRVEPINLHQELEKNPAFFVEVLTLLYKPKTRQIQELADTENREMIISRASHARKLLDSFNRIPGASADNNEVDENVLHSWISTVQKLAVEADRLEVADMQIGMLLAKYPEKNDQWPPEAICSVIDQIDSEVLNRNFITQVSNNHGSSTRSPFEGGTVERRLAERFNGYADNFKGKYRKLSKLFRDLAAQFLHRAKREDEEAERNRLEY